MNKTLITNPIIWADVPDVDVIRAEDAYYMISTSMHSMPGCPIMRSEDLMHWEIVGYVYDMFEDNEAHRLEDGQNIYGQGSGRPAYAIIRANSMFVSPATIPGNFTCTARTISFRGRGSVRSSTDFGMIRACSSMMTASS